MTRYFEDFSTGDTWTFGPREVTRKEIQEFAQKYDPQPMHTDPSTAAEGPFEGLIASGWHTVSLSTRLVVDGLISDMDSRGGLGTDSLRWPNPVRPGDDISVAVEVVDTEDFDEERGTISFSITTTNQDGETVLSMVVDALFGRREASE